MLLEDHGDAIRVYVESPGEEGRRRQDPALAALGEKAQVRFTPLRLQAAAVAGAGAEPGEKPSGKPGEKPGKKPGARSRRENPAAKKEVET